MKRPEIKDYKNITGAGAYDYVADVNEYMNHLEQQLKLFAIPVVSTHVCPECGATMTLGLRKVLYICDNETCGYNERAN